MKKTICVFVAMALLTLLQQVSAQDVSFQFFYDSFAPHHGRWVQIDDYGNCWIPPEQDPDWHPYAAGHWVDTDDGWLWVSDDSEPWGWATYHYGRWINVDGYGWCWVPGYTWAPAWVTWRYGDDYCGWAPLPPSRFTGPIGPGWYNFCPVRSFGDPSLRLVIINRAYNYNYINRTRVIDDHNVSRYGSHYVSGPPRDEINRFAQHPIQHYTINRPAGSRGGTHATTLQFTQNNIVHNPVVNDGRSVNHPPQVGPNTPPPATPSRSVNRAAIPSVNRFEQPAPVQHVTAAHPNSSFEPQAQHPTYHAPAAASPAPQHSSGGGGGNNGGGHSDDNQGGGDGHSGGDHQKH